MLVFENAIVLDGTGQEAFGPTTVVVEGERIMSVGEAYAGDADRINLSGKVLMPGIVQAHGHIMLEFDGVNPPLDPETLATVRAVKRLEAIVHAGITTFRDMSGYNSIELVLRQSIKKGLIKGPRLVCAGRRLAMTGGFFHILGAEVDGPEALAKAVRENWKARSDLVKFVAAGGPNPRGMCCEPGGPEYTYEELKAGADETRRLNLTSAAHVVGPSSIRNCIEAGIDCLEHATYLDDELAAMAAAKGTQVVPTLSVYYNIVANKEKLANYPVDPKWAELALEASANTLELCLKHKLQVGMGTDAGTLMNSHTDMVTEFKLWSDAGWDILQSVRAATLGAARICGMDREIGSVEPGKLADLIVIEKHPREAIEALGRPEHVFLGGQRIH